MITPWEPGRLFCIYHCDEHPFDENFLTRCAAFIRNHPLLAETTLNSGFTGTQGFSLALTRGGLPRLNDGFPLFGAYLEHVAPDRCNAFFLNPLVIAQGQAVAAHIDRSLGPWTRPDDCPFPVKVSVLYLDVPKDLKGGGLKIHRPRWHLLASQAMFTPKLGQLVEFRGDLRHEVSAVTQASTPRISLVLEHYDLPPSLIAKIPDFYARSTRSFDSFLSDALDSSIDPVAL